MHVPGRYIDFDAFEGRAGRRSQVFAKSTKDIFKLIVGKGSPFELPATHHHADLLKIAFGQLIG